MALRQVLLYPDARLKQKCQPMDPCCELTQSIAHDLLDTMDAGPPRTVGIAAPQIGEMVRVIVVDTSRNPKYPGSHGLLTLVNPEITAAARQQVFREGCLSLPDFTANITRHDEITVKGFSLNGQVITLTTTGFESVVLQHEIDHLNGILFLDRVAHVKTDLFRRKTI